MGRRQVLLVAGIILSAVLFAYGQVTTGTISGSVTDSTGAALPGAKIVIQNEETGATRAVQADSSGRYTAPSLGLGKYRVTVSQEGFQTENRTGIELTVGREAVVNIQMSVGAVSQTVEVTGEAPLVDTTKSSVDYLVADTTVRDLPLNGRDLSQLVLLNPGTVVTELPHNPAFNYGYGKLFSIAGLKYTDNIFLLDGTDVGDYRDRAPSAPSGNFFGAETVKEFEVKAGNFGAAYGHALGGVMNAVSQGGTNSFHGDAFEFLRNSDLDARAFFDGTIPPFKRNQFGATFGGPIKKDKTFFFAGYEALRQRQGFTSIANVPSSTTRAAANVNPKIAGYLALYPVANGPVLPGGATAQFNFVDAQSATDDFGQIRVDHQFSEKDSLFGRLTNQNSNRVQGVNGGFPGFGDVAEQKTRLSTVSETHIFSPTALNTFRVAFNRVAPGQVGTFATWPANLLAVPNQTIPPIISVTGLGTLGGDSKPSYYGITNRFEYIDDVNLTRGNHSLQFGGAWQRMQFNLFQPDRPQGQWSFSSIPNFLAGIPSTYRGTPLSFGNYERGFRQNFWGLYLQDTWKLRPTLTLNIGMRWEPATPPAEVNGLISNLRNITDAAPTVGSPYWLNKTWHNFGPRFGFAWSPFASGKTSIRGGAGIYFGRLDGNMYWTPSARDGVISPSYQVTNPDPALFPNAIAAIQSLKSAGGGGTAYVLPYSNLATPGAYQWNFTVQQQLGSSSVISATYAGNHGVHATSLSNYNTPQAQFVNGDLRIPVGAGVVNPNFDAVMVLATNMDSWYHALQMNFQRRMAKGLQVQVAYTFSKSLNEADSADSAGIIPNEGTVFYANDPKTQKGRSGLDVPQYLSVNYVYELPYGPGRQFGATSGLVGKILGSWDLNGIVTAKSGQPFDVQVGIPSAVASLIVGRRPNAVLGQSPLIWGSPSNSTDPSGLSRYFNPAVGFALPDPRSLGNLGRMALRGPGLTTWDLGLSKGFPLTERFQLKFRAEMFNLLNHPNFAGPAAQLYDSQNRPVGSAGVITQVIGSARQIQFGLKLLF